MTATRRDVSRAASALRSIAPSDVAAWQTLATTDPARSLSLRDAVARIVAAAPRPGEDVATVMGHAVVIVARLALADSTRDDAHAASRAVVFARQAVRAAAVTDDESLDDPDSDVATRLASWSGGMTPETVVVGAPDGLASRMRDALASLPESTRETFGAMSGAWLAHRGGCERCEAPGARPGRVTLSTVRAHVRGLATRDAAGKRLLRADAATLAAVADVLAPVVAATPLPDRSGPAWDLIRAMRDDDAPRRGAGNGDRLTVTAWEAPKVSARVTWESTRPGVHHGAIPADRRAATVARRLAAWETAETARVARVRRAQDADAMWRTGVSGAVTAVPAGESTPDAWGRTVPTPGGHAVATGAPGAPLWTGGPYAGPAPMPADDAPDRGAYVGEARTLSHARTVTVRASGPVRPVTRSRLVVAEGTPDVATVTVRRPDGTVTARPMTDAEQDATATVRETRTVEYVTPDGVQVETVPVIWGEYPGEARAEGGSTAPIGARDRRAGEPDGQVRSFKVAPSPRKRAAGSTGPTVPCGPGARL